MLASVTWPSRHRVTNEARSILHLAAPIALAQFGLMAMSLVDTAVLGRVSKVDLAAVSLGRNIGFAAQTLSMGIAMSLETLASQAIGAREPLRAWQAFVATLKTVAMVWFPGVVVALATTLALPALHVEHVVVDAYAPLSSTLGAGVARVSLVSWPRRPTSRRTRSPGFRW